MQGQDIVLRPAVEMIGKKTRCKSSNEARERGQRLIYSLCHHSEGKSNRYQHLKAIVRSNQAGSIGSVGQYRSQLEPGTLRQASQVDNEALLYRPRRLARGLEEAVMSIDLLARTMCSVTLDGSDSSQALGLIAETPRRKVEYWLVGHLLVGEPYVSKEARTVVLRDAQKLLLPRMLV